MDIIKDILDKEYKLDKTKQELNSDTSKNLKKIKYDEENCDNFQQYFTYYYVEQMAMLWCGIEPTDFNEVISECEYAKRAIPKHPYIGCLEHRARAIMDAIDAKQLAVGRDGKTHSISDDHIAPERRTILLKDFKEWLMSTFPSEKPKLIFDDMERKTHTSITTEAYLALVADRDHLKTRISNAENIYKKQIAEINKLKEENVKLNNLPTSESIGERLENTYLNIIGGLVNLMLSETPNGRKISVYNSQSDIINALVAHYPGKKGLSQRSLEGKFSQANLNLQKE